MARRMIETNITEEDLPVICDDLGILWVKGFATRDGGDKNSKNRLYIAIAEEMA